MNIMGVGFLELVVVLLVAFLVLGPARSVEMAKKSGKVLGDLRRTFSEVTTAVSMEQGQHSAWPPPPGVPSRPDLPEEDVSEVPSTYTGDGGGQPGSSHGNGPGSTV